MSLLGLFRRPAPGPPAAPSGANAPAQGPSSQVERALAARRPWFRGWAAPPSLTPHDEGLTAVLQTWASPFQKRGLMNPTNTAPALPPQKQPVDTSVFRNFPTQSPWDA